MIAVDTNVLLRYLLDDDPAQSEKAEKLITGNDVVLVTDVVLVETLWYCLKQPHTQKTNPNCMVFAEGVKVFKRTWTSLTRAGYGCPGFLLLASF